MTSATKPPEEGHTFGSAFIFWRMRGFTVSLRMKHTGIQCLLSLPVPVAGMVPASAELLCHLGTRPVGF